MSRTSGAQVTVLMPVYNGARYLDAQIESILSQTHAALRLVLWDDSSTDDSRSICDDFAHCDDRVVVHSNATNLGLLRTIELLTGLVDTPYFALSDQDDVWDREKLESSIQLMEASDSALVYSDVRTVDARGHVLDESYWAAKKLTPMRVDGPPLLAIYRNPVLGHTIVARREVAARLGSAPAGVRFYEPWLLAAAHSIGTSCAVERPLGSYRVHSDNVVGPAPASLPARLSRLAKTGLRARQAYRFHALEVVSRYFPAVAGITAPERGRMRGRVLSVSRLYVALRESCSPQMSWGQRARETALFALTPRESGAER